MRNKVKTDSFYEPLERIRPQFWRNNSPHTVFSPNEREILRIIRKYPQISRTEINQHCALTQQSIHRILDALIHRQILILGDPKPNAGKGQPSPTLELNPEFAFTCGLSIEVGQFTMVIADFCGRVIASREFNLRYEARTDALLILKSAFDELCMSHNLNTDQFFGMGASISGFLQNGTSFNASEPLAEWSLIELGPLFDDIFDAPVWTGNTANTAAVCESMFGAGNGLKSFAYFSIDYGFGGALIANGELWRGAHGNAGELSAMFSADEDYDRPALESLLKALRKETSTIKFIGDIAQHYDPNWLAVSQWKERTAPFFNRTCNAVSAIFDPEAIIVGGQIPVPLAQDLITKVKFNRRNRHGRTMATPKLLTSKMNKDASAIGAAIMPFLSA